jgi:ubiquinone/menaquinone biosynthesis C-methylase UbiE
MDLSYEETNKKLSTRINVHNKFSEKDIDPWTKNLVDIKPGETILEVGCGNGKQVRLYADLLMNQGKIFACDISEGLLEEAKASTTNKGFNNITFFNHDMNNGFEFEDNSFDLVSCCFAIYYVKDSEKLINEFKRILKPGGRLFIMGPSPKNTEEFWNLHGKVAGSIPPKALIRRSRIEKEFIPFIKEQFVDVSINIFNNNIAFPSTDDVLNYYTHSLLFKDGIADSEKEFVLKKMEQEIKDEIQNSGEYILKKEVYGVIAHKDMKK